MGCSGFEEGTVAVVLKTLAGKAISRALPAATPIASVRVDAAALLGIAEEDEVTLVAFGRRWRQGDEDDGETLGDLAWLPLGAVDP